MARLWKNNPETRGGKYLVTRRDGTIPEWPHFVLGAKDPATPAALRAYANSARAHGMDPAFCSDIISLADEFEEYREKNGTGDPDAPPHRVDDPSTVLKMGEIFNVPIGGNLQTLPSGMLVSPPKLVFELDGYVSSQISIDPGHIASVVQSKVNGLNSIAILETYTGQRYTVKATGRNVEMEVWQAKSDVV